MKKLYYYKTWSRWSKPEIYTATILKETEKTFKIEDDFWHFKTTIRKASMVDGYDKYFLTEDEAKKSIKEYLEHSISSTREQITKQELIIVKYEDWLKELNDESKI